MGKSLSNFRFNVNEVIFDEQWIKKTSTDSTLDFFWFLPIFKFVFQNLAC